MVMNKLSLVVALQSLRHVNPIHGKGPLIFEKNASYFAFQINILVL